MTYFISLAGKTCQFYKSMKPIQQFDISFNPDFKTKT